MSQQQIEVLDEMECWSLVRTQTVGRFVYSDDLGPAAIPVNYGQIENKIVFRVGETSHLREVIAGEVAFEVDDLHPEEGTGWSVLVRGRAREVHADEVIDLIRVMQRIPQPLAEGVHNVWIEVTPKQATGRRLGDLFVAALLSSDRQAG